MNVRNKLDLNRRETRIASRTNDVRKSNNKTALRPEYVTFIQNLCPNRVMRGSHAVRYILRICARCFLKQWFLIKLTLVKYKTVVSEYLKLTRENREWLCKNKLTRRY